MIGSPTQLLIILLVVALIFGTGKLKNIGKDIGSAIKDFKSTLNEKDEDKKDAAPAAEKKTAE